MKDYPGGRGFKPLRTRPASARAAWVCTSACALTPYGPKPLALAQVRLARARGHLPRCESDEGGLCADLGADVYRFPSGHLEGVVSSQQ